MVSSFPERGCETTLRALELGAVDFVEKPKLDFAAGTLDLPEEIVAKVKTAARSHVVRRTPGAAGDAGCVPQRGGAAEHERGTEALRELPGELPPGAPGVVVVQDMPERNTRSFAERLDSLCQIGVREAVDDNRSLQAMLRSRPATGICGWCAVPSPLM